MNLATFLKANSLAGVFGTLTLSPLFYLYEVAVGGTALRVPGVLDVLMLLVGPVLFGLAFGVTALAAYPAVVFLERRGIVRFGEPEGTRGEV